jgi:hypothetical protein
LRGRFFSESEEDLHAFGKLIDRAKDLQPVVGDQSGIEIGNFYILKFSGQNRSPIVRIGLTPENSRFCKKHDQIPHVVAAAEDSTEETLFDPDGIRRATGFDLSLDIFKLPLFEVLAKGENNFRP